MADTHTPDHKIVIGSAAIGKLLGISRQRVNQLYDQGRLPRPVQMHGKARLWLTEDILAWAVDQNRGVDLDAIEEAPPGF